MQLQVEDFLREEEWRQDRTIWDSQIWDSQMWDRQQDQLAAHAEQHLHQEQDSAVPVEHQYHRSHSVVHVEQKWHQEQDSAVPVEHQKHKAKDESKDEKEYIINDSIPCIFNCI